MNLNVRGGLFETTSKTLWAVPGSLLFELGESASIAVAAANASGAAAAVAEAADSTIFIDLSPRLFDTVQPLHFDLLNPMRQTHIHIFPARRTTDFELPAGSRHGRFRRPALVPKPSRLASVDARGSILSLK